MKNVYIECSKGQPNLIIKKFGCLPEKTFYFPADSFENPDSYLRRLLRSAEQTYDLVIKNSLDAFP